MSVDCVVCTVLRVCSGEHSYLYNVHSGILWVYRTPSWMYSYAVFRTYNHMLTPEHTITSILTNRK